MTNFYQSAAGNLIKVCNLVGIDVASESIDSIIDLLQTDTTRELLRKADASKKAFPFCWRYAADEIIKIGSGLAGKAIHTQAICAVTKGGQK